MTSWMLLLAIITPGFAVGLGADQRPGTHLEIINLNDYPGMIALKAGKTFIEIGYDWLVHTFRLDTFQGILNQYEIMINQLNSNANTKDFRDILRLKFMQTNSTFQKLNFKRKTKRAINILGTLVKTITGNLDHNDLVNLNQKISNLHYTNNQLVTNNNEQIKINYEFQQRINNLTEVIYRERRNR